MKQVSVLMGMFAMASAAFAADVHVSMTDFAFNPSTVTVSPGDNIIWTNNGSYVHTSTSGTNGAPDGTWDSGNISAGGTYHRVFPDAGRFPYFCRYHYAMGMVGEVVVGSGGVEEAPGAVGTRQDIQSFPNPFRSTTTLNLAPSAPRGTQLRIFDAGGQLVRSLAATGLKVAWNGRDSQGRVVPAGIYHCISGAGSVVLCKLP